MEEPNWGLPGMEKFSPRDIEFFKRHIATKANPSGSIVNTAVSLGRAYWPTTNQGYLDEHLLRKIADFIEIQNKPFWDEYDEYCKAEQEEAEAAARGECTNLEGCKNDCHGACGYTTSVNEEIPCLDELGSTAIPTFITETSVNSKPAPA